MPSELTVLIVEDDADVRLGCEQALRLEGLATRGVGSAEAALREAGPGYAGVVVSDIRLPGMDGMALLAQLRERDPALPVIMITGHGDVGLAVQGTGGADVTWQGQQGTPDRVGVGLRRLDDEMLLVLHDDRGVGQVEQPQA